MFSPALKNLIEALMVLPGVGAKSAQRMAFFLMNHRDTGAKELATSIGTAITSIHECQICRNLTDQTTCVLCSDAQRDAGKLCVVESPIDVNAIEDTHVFKGLYFVLHGRLSPIDNIGPEKLGISRLLQLVEQRSVTELILATNLTIEGEATAHYINEACCKIVPSITRIAHGVPVGGELEYVDANTLVHAFSGRK